MKLKVLDLFSGIGGFSLGLERTGGFETVAFCENDAFCRQVLASHWPDVPVLGDIAAVDVFPEADVITAGYPCQDISIANPDATGLSGTRSGLFWHAVRAIRMVRPQHVILENVAEMLGRGMGDVVGALAGCGYDAEWDCLPASAIGAPHRRDRVWIVADATSGGWGVNGNVSETRCDTRAGQPSDCGADVANACITRLQSTEQAGWRKPIVTSPDVWRAAAQCGWRRAEPGMGGTLDGVSAGAHRYPVEVEPWEGDTPRTVGRGYADRPSRLRAIGNAVVPQISELIGRAILEAHR